MKYFFWLLMVVASLWLSACGSSAKSDSESKEALMTDAIRKTGPQRMQVSEVKSQVTLRGKEYVSEVVRRPDESLPVVTNQQGDKFIDNRITLRVTCGGKTVIDKVITKELFAPYIDGKFMKYALLEGVVFDEVKDGVLVYAASVGYPQSDLYVPLRLTVSPGGKLVISKADLMEDWHQE